MIALPISGLRASDAGNAVDLLNSSGRVVASYWGLRVIDAEGKVVPATMSTRMPKETRSRSMSVIRAHSTL